MTDPNKKLREYLDTLIHRFLNTKSLHRELRHINEWEVPGRYEAIKLSFYFFHLTTYSLSRIFLTELAILLSRKEDRSLLDWLDKAKEHASPLEPTRAIPGRLGGGRELVKPKEYRAIIDGQLSQLDSLEEVIKRIKARRDKAIAHLDKTYFNNPRALYRDYPLSDDDIDRLFEVVSDILRMHHSLLFQSSLTMEIVSGHHVDVVLRYARAFYRARKDFGLIKKGFRPGDYTRDEYME